MKHIRSLYKMVPCALTAAVMSPRARTLADLASEIDRQDKVMRDVADVLLAAMQKRDALMVCLKQLAKEMR